jgi:hypothetical protein
MTWAHFSSDRGAVIVVVGAVCFWGHRQICSQPSTCTALNAACGGAGNHAAVLASVLHRHRRQSEHLDAVRVSRGSCTALPLFAAWV